MWGFQEVLFPFFLFFSYASDAVTNVGGLKKKARRRNLHLACRKRGVNENNS